MARINLLPWREAARIQRRKEFGIMTLTFVILTVLGVVYWHWFNVGLMDYQKQRNRYMQDQIAQVEKQIREIRRLEKTRTQLIARMKVIQDLQASRPQIVRLIDELVATVPQGAYLQDLVQNGQRVSLKGRAQSNSRISAYMRNIDDSPWMANPHLKLIEKSKVRDRDSNFELDFKQIVPAGKEES